MAAYILRRLLLMIPTLIGIMVINFTLVQFVPGGPIEQIIAQVRGGGDVFSSISGGSGDAGRGSFRRAMPGGTTATWARGACPLTSSPIWKSSSASTSRRSSGFWT